MVKLTVDYIKKHNMNKSANNNNTHLYMNKKHITELDDFTEMFNIAVIYLHKNQLRNVDNLSGLKNLTHLYLQWNSITYVDNLNNLPNLTNLYLGYNAIGILKGFKEMPRLEVLHVQNQKLLTNNVNLVFDSEAIFELSKSLLEINVSGNNITSLTELQPLQNIVNVDISNNLVSNLNEICNIVHGWKKLKTLEIKGNPVIKNKRYECDIIASSLVLDTINGKRVTETTRIFLQTLKTIKLKHEKRKQKEKRTEFSSETRSNFMT